MPQSERWLGSAASQCSTLFLSTPSTRRATFTVTTRPVKSLFLPTPSTRRATRVMSLTWDVLAISTHALHEEGDSSIRPLSRQNLIFLPTPSTRRATVDSFDPLRHRLNFYPRPPRGGRPQKTGWVQDTQDISTHALHEEGDLAHRRPDTRR